MVRCPNLGLGLLRGFELRFVLACGYKRVMEQGFLNRTNKKSLVNDDTTSSLLRGLAKRVKNNDGKLMGKDGKPLMPYRCIVDDKIKETKTDRCEVGAIRPLLL